MFKIGDIIRAKENAPYSITTAGWIGEVESVCTAPLTGQILAVRDLRDSAGEDIYRVSSRYFELVSDALENTSEKSLDNDEDTFKEKVERIKGLNYFEIETIVSYKFNKKNNTRVKMLTTRIYTGLGIGLATCSEADYIPKTGAWIAAAKITASKSEECNIMFNIAMDNFGSKISTSIIKRLADRACGGSFETAWKRWNKKQERIFQEECTCETCGKRFKTPEDARNHEKWHIENKKNRHERYMIRHEAKRRLAEAKREEAIKNAMKGLGEK